MAGSIDSRPTSQTPFDSTAVARVSARSYAPLQVLLLRRLAKLLHQRRQCQKLVDPSDWHLALLNKAIYATYCDAVALDMATEADQLLGAAQLQLGQ